MADPDDVTIDTIRAGARRLDGVVRRTPLLSSPFLDAIAGRRVLVKPECLQHTGSFKFRGGYSAVSALAPGVRARGVIAFSSGNHAQGVAMAARMHDAPCVIIMPRDAPRLKIENTRALGAEVVLYDRATEDRDAIGARLAAERGLTLIKPFDNAQVIAGQGTAGLEIASQARAVGVSRADVLVCCGGGGLTSGIALALEAEAPGLRARPVEPEGFDDAGRSLAQGRIVTNDRISGSICDAILTPAPGAMTFPIMHRLCGPGLAVGDAEVLRAMALAALRLKIVAEPGGAVALAAALWHAQQIEGDTVIAVVSGGNADPAMLGRAVAGAETMEAVHGTS
jgi:threonine dehydratase